MSVEGDLGDFETDFDEFEFINLTLQLLEVALITNLSTFDLARRVKTLPRMLSNFSKNKTVASTDGLDFVNSRLNFLAENFNEEDQRLVFFKSTLLEQKLEFSICLFDLVSIDQVVFEKAVSKEVAFDEEFEFFKILNFFKGIDSSDIISPYLLLTLLKFISIDVLNQNIQQTQMHLFKLTKDSLKMLNNELFTNSENFSDTNLKAVLQFQFIIFFKHRQRFEYMDPFSFNSDPDYLEKQLEKLIFDHNIFNYFVLMVSSNNTSDLINIWKDVRVDFRCEIYSTLELLISHFIQNFGRSVRNTKKSDEDVVKKGYYERQRQYLNNKIVPPTKTFQTLLTLISVLYHDRPDAALQFWTSNELLKFLKWASDVKSLELKSTYFRMMASLATGPKSSHHAFELFNSQQTLSISAISWQQMFAALQHFSSTIYENPNLDINPQDIEVMIGFLNLLKTTVSYSPVARFYLFENQSTVAIQELFRLLVCRIPTNLKAALFEAITGFCTQCPGIDYLPGHSDIIANVWLLLEESQVLSEKDGIFSKDGIVFDLEETETVSQVFPETLAFLGLLNSLFSTSNFRHITSAVENLGEARRTPGIYPFIDFVIEFGFLKIFQRSYAKEEEKFRMTSICLEIFNSCVEYFFDSVLKIEFERAKFISTSSPQLHSFSETEENLFHSLSKFPGFKIVCNVLTGSTFTKILFDILKLVKQIDLQKGSSHFYFGNSILECLALIFRILKYQDTFLDKIVPKMIEITTFGGGKSTIFSNSMVGLDQLLAYHKDIVIILAQLLNCTSDDQIVLLATKILKIISCSNVFLKSDTDSMQCKQSRIVKLFQGNEVVINGFVNRLMNGEVKESMEVADSDLLSNLKYHGGIDLEISGIGNSVRISILDLLLENLLISNNSGIATFAHFLLGFDCTKFLQNTNFYDPNSKKNKAYLLHYIINLVSADTENSKSNNSLNFNKLHPTLSERCCHLLYKLCLNLSTYEPTLRYLRSTGDFILKQLAHISDDIKQEGIEVMVLEQENENLSLVKRNEISALHRKAWLMKLAAIDLHTNILSRKTSEIEKLFNCLFLNNNTFLFENFESNERKGSDQPLTKILEIFNSLNLKEDVSSDSPLDLGSLKFFRNIQFEHFVVKNDRGCEVFDIRLIFKYLSAIEYQLEADGIISSVQLKVEFQNELKDLLYNILRLNSSKEYYFAQKECLIGWNEIVLVALNEGYHYFPLQSREELMYKILSNILPRINNANTRTEFIEILSSTSLTLISKLNSDKFIQNILQAPSTNENFSGLLRLPLEGQLLVLEHFLEGVIRTGSTSKTRGNYYTSIISYLHLTSSTNGNHSIQNNSNIAVFEKFGDRFFELVCRDATDGPEVWKTVAFSLLSAVFSIYFEKSSTGKNSLLIFLSEKNHLDHFVKTIKLDDVNLQKVLRDNV
ncbi:hypothetical protein HK099_005449, partial [Clydaea vesicula]